MGAQPNILLLRHVQGCILQMVNFWDKFLCGRSKRSPPFPLSYGKWWFFCSLIKRVFYIWSHQKVSTRTSLATFSIKISYWFHNWPDTATLLSIYPARIAHGLHAQNVGKFGTQYTPCPTPGLTHYPTHHGYSFRSRFSRRHRGIAAEKHAGR